MKLQAHSHFTECNKREACLCKNKFNFKVDYNMKTNTIVSNKCLLARSYTTPTEEDGVVCPLAHLSCSHSAVGCRFVFELSHFSFILRNDASFRGSLSQCFTQ